MIQKDKLHFIHRSCSCRVDAFKNSNIMKEGYGADAFLETAEKFWECKAITVSPIFQNNNFKTEFHPTDKDKWNKACHLYSLL